MNALSPIGRPGEVMQALQGERFIKVILIFSHVAQNL